MDRDAIYGQVRPVIEGLVREKGFELFELNCRYEGRDLVLRVFADRPEGGISLEDCAGLNKELGIILDGQDILSGGYILEVASPGMDRPLVSAADFKRCPNKEVRLFLKEKVNDKFELQGAVKEVSATEVILDTGAAQIAVPLEIISRGKQII
jgi:ribosome maturation factor RimP